MFCLKLNAPGLWVSLALRRELLGHTPSVNLGRGNLAMSIVQPGQSVHH